MLFKCWLLAFVLLKLPNSLALLATEPAGTCTFVDDTDGDTDADDEDDEDDDAWVWLAVEFAEYEDGL